ncbi:hypothetical protein Glove_452g14 [Diversispora epigaea]|uniref:Uncharacterized protein n=1 Tax=Diversispora epigaea TaxID=1348612 RepID=A0A397GR19_9GLOM|nr:hypothetical protein Glove_452g14 [Diversispora epigaea]
MFVLINGFFLEVSEAKTAIDSHHTQITHAIKQYVKLDYKITSGKDIEMAIKDLSENNKTKQKIETIARIRNWNEFTWIYDGEKASYIYARPLPKFKELNKFSLSKIQKIIKNQTIIQPNPIVSTHLNSPKLLTIPRVNHQVIDITNEIEINLEHERELIKRIPIHVKYLLETMFYAETADPRKKITAAEMKSELMQRVQEREIEEEDVLKESTISNWITSFSQG